MVNSSPSFSLGENKQRSNSSTPSYSSTRWVPPSTPHSRLSAKIPTSISQTIFSDSPLYATSSNDSPLSSTSTSPCNTGSPLWVSPVTTRYKNPQTPNTLGSHQPLSKQPTTPNPEKAITTSGNEDDEPFDLSDYMWYFVVAKGVGIAPKKKIKPYVEVECVTGVYTENGWKNIKASNKTKSQAIEGNNPIYRFQAITMNCENAWNRYNGVKVSCYSKKGTAIGPDFLGEGYAWLEYEIKGPDQGLSCDYEMELLTKTGKKMKHGGSLIIRSLYTKAEKTTDTPAAKVTNGSTLLTRQERAEAAMKRCDKVTVSSNGRREYKYIQSSGNITTWGELPPIQFNNPNLSKKEKKYRFDTVIGLWLVNSCQLAYRNEDVIKSVCLNVWDMEEYTFLDDVATDTQGFITYNEEFIIVCFRGTESGRDMMTNINCALYPAPRHPERYQKNGVKVHNGFNQAMSSVWPIVEEFVHKAYQKFPNMKLLICGHSLGGALANLCYSYFVLSDNPRKVHSVYTIGQPRVGNKQLKEQLDLHSPETSYIRITNNLDVVPRLPPNTIGFLHCGTHIQFDPYGRLIFEPPAWKKAQLKALSYQDSAASLSYGAVSDHGSAEYRSLVERYWVKSEYSKMEGDCECSCECEKIFFLIDMLQEDIKMVKRFKPKFSALALGILDTKPILVYIEELLAKGIDEEHRFKLSMGMTGYFETLNEFKGLILAHRKELSIIQRVGAPNEKTFNKKISGISLKIQQNFEVIDEVLSTAKSVASGQAPYLSFYQSSSDIEYDRTLYLALNFTKIDFANLVVIEEPIKLYDLDVVVLMRKVDGYLEKGEYNEALSFIETIRNLAEGTVITLSEEELSKVSFFEAKALINLGNTVECFECLSNIKVILPYMISDEAFKKKIKFHKEFETFQQRYENQSAATVSIPDNTKESVDDAI